MGARSLCDPDRIHNTDLAALIAVAATTIPAACPPQALAATLAPEASGARSLRKDTEIQIDDLHAGERVTAAALIARECSGRGLASVSAHQSEFGRPV